MTNHVHLGRRPPVPTVCVPEPEIRGRASSRFDRGTVERRLVAIEHDRSAAAAQERAFLEQLLARME